ncbi:MAG TPA: LysR family transcriptional regulator [Novosphingobium sp.]|nr:LysR family transcriptional regulator [Novosphingobium sp.]
MHLKRLAYFVVASQQQGGLAAAAAELDITQSTLSAALKVLAEEVGTPLFEHVHRRMHPSRAGLWLFRSALPILHAEEFARSWISARGPDTRVTHLTVDVKLSFALGRVSKAVGCGIQAFSHTHPDIFVEPRFADMRDDDELAAAMPAITAYRHVSLVIDAVASTVCDLEPGIEQMELQRDPWVIVRKHGVQDYEGGDEPFIVPALGEALLRQLGAISESRAGARVHLADEPAGALPRMLHEQPSASFLMPRSMAADRLGLQNISIQSMEPPVDSLVVARFRKGDNVARSLALEIRKQLEAPERNLIFRPVISLRQMRYHRALYEMGSVTAAARRLLVAQPALTDQLRKLEQTLGAALFIRSRRGLDPTASAVRLRQVSSFVQDRVRRIDIESTKFFGGEASTLRLGVIPSAGPGSLLLQGLAQAIEQWQACYPTMRLQLFEAQSDPLQAMVKAGTVSFAVVERSIPDVARVRLTKAEPLAVVFDPGACVPAKTELSFDDIAHLPLILPTRQSGLRQIIEDAALRAGVRFSPKFEVNSMPLLLQMLRGRALYTIIPVSAARRDINEKILDFLPISDRNVEREFFAIHSSERNMNASERDFIKILQMELRSEEMKSSDGIKPIRQDIRMHAIKPANQAAWR